jgi:hypothetical protein
VPFSNENAEQGSYATAEAKTQKVKRPLSKRSTAFISKTTLGKSNASKNSKDRVNFVIDKSSQQRLNLNRFTVRKEQQPLQQ